MYNASCGSKMILFFKEIPDDTLHSELKAFIQPVIKGGLLGTKGKVTKIDIIALKDKVTNVIEFHALINIEPETAALRVIQKLNGQRFKDRKIKVKQYVLRNWRNDKRSDESEAILLRSENRKNPHRRRKLDIIDKDSPEYSSYESLYRHF
jgi:hypothetical protein